MTINILGFGRTVWVTDPELVKEVFARDSEMPLSPAGNLVKPIFGTKSVTGLDGAAHMRRRKLLLPRFHGKAIEGFEAGFLGACERTMERWSPGQELELHPEMYRLTMDFLFEVLMGITDRERAARLTKASEGADGDDVAVRGWRLDPPRRRPDITLGVLPSPAAEPRPPPLRGDRGPPAGGRSRRGRRRHPLDADRGPLRGRLGALRRGDP